MSSGSQEEMSCSGNNRGQRIRIPNGVRRLCSRLIDRRCRCLRIMLYSKDI